MSHIWNLIFIAPLLALLISYVHGMSPSQPFGRDKVLEALNSEIYKATVTPNQKTCAFFRPEISRNGLTFCFDVIISVQNIRCTSIEEVELVYKQIYRNYLNTMNSIRIIRPFLAEFPLTLNSFCLSINFQDGNGKNLLPPCFSGIYVREQSVKFFQDVIEEENDEKDRKHCPGYIVVKKIPLSEATWLQEFTSSSVPRKKADPKVKVPTYDRPSPRAFAIGTALFGFKKSFADANSLEVITSGAVGDDERDSRAFEFVLGGEQCINLEEARKLAATCSKELLEFVRNDKECRIYLKERSTWKGSKDPSTFPEPRHTSFRISFWDENVDRQPAPYIAEIRVIGENFKYFTSDEGQRLVLVHEETFDEAQAFLKALKDTTAK